MVVRAPILVSLVLVLVACASPPLATPEPTATSIPTAEPATPTPIPTPTSAPTATRTPLPTPTAFITPPPAGQAAIVPILMYHHLSDLPPDASELQETWTVAPKNFEAQIKLVAERGYRTITMAQLVAHLKRGQPLPAKPIIISFDDGWVDDYVVAYPVLKKYNFIGTFFVYTNAIGHKQFLTWPQLEEMSAAGMDIQSHTLSHPHLRQLTPDAALKEIADSKVILEKRLGKPVIAFNYPFGEYNAAVIELVKRAGFESAVTLASGYKQRSDELYTLRRIRITDTDTLEVFAGRLP